MPRGNLEGMTREHRRNEILSMLGQQSFTSCSQFAQPNEAVHMLKKQRIRRFAAGCPELERQQNIKALVESLIWFNRDISLFKGRPLSLLDRIMGRFNAGAEEIWGNLSSIVDHVKSSTLYIHIGEGTVIRVMGGPVKMYISEHSDFYEAAPAGFFLENYYLNRNRENNRSFTLNIITREMPYHFEIKNPDVALAYMLTRHMAGRCEEVIHGVVICQQVSSQVTGEARIGGSLVPTGIEECTKVEFLGRFLLALGVKEDFASKPEGESATYQRLSTLDVGILVSNLEWISNAKIPTATIDVGQFSKDDIPSSHGCMKYIFDDKRIFKRNVSRTIYCTGVLVSLLAFASWATIAQDISAPERAEKWLTLALFGSIAIAFAAAGSDMRRDRLRELFFFREEIFSSRGMEEHQVYNLITAISNNVAKRRDSVKKKNAGWLGADIDGNFEFHRLFRTSELSGARVLLRRTGDITFSWAGQYSERESEKFVSLSTDGALHVGREAGPASGVALDVDVGVQ